MLLRLKNIFSRAPAATGQQSTADRRADPVLFPQWMTTSPQWSEWNSEVATKEGYKASPWVYACIKRRADAVASVPWRVERRRGDDWDTDTRHPLNELLAAPNPDMSLAELIELTVTHLDLSGNSFWQKLRAGNRVKYLWPIMPHSVQITPGRSRIASLYTVGLNTKIEPDDMVHLTYTNPGDLLFGQSPLMAAGKAVDVDNSAAAWQKVSMQNRGVPDGVFVGKDLTQEQFEQATEVIKDNYANIGNARAPWVLSDFTWQPMSLSPAEVDFIETRHLSMKEICAVYGVPSEMISGMGDANRASSETVRKTFWLDTILPLLARIEAILNRTLVTEDNVRIVYDTSNVPALQENRQEVMDAATALWRMGVPFNEINQRLELGFDDIPGGEVGYLSGGLLPANFDFDAFAEPQSEDDIKALIKAAYGTSQDR